MDSKDITVAVNECLTGDTKTCSATGVDRRDFVKRAGKALYIAPTLALLGTAPALAQFGSPPPPPGSAPQPPAPAQ